MTLIYYYYLASIILYTVKLEKECAYNSLCNRVLYMYYATKMCFWSHTTTFYDELIMMNLFDNFHH